MQRTICTGVLLLVIAALLLLQSADAADGLVVDLIPFALIAGALLLSGIALPIHSLPDRRCLGLTIAFVIWIVLRCLTSPAPYEARMDLYLVLACFAIYLLSATVLRTPAFRIAVFVMLLLFAMWHVVIGLIQFGLGQNFAVTPFLESVGVNKRASGLYMNPDHFAGLLEILSIFALAIACWSRRPNWFRVLVGYLGLVCYIGIILTGSRGGYLSTAVSLIVFAFLTVLALRAGRSSLLCTYGTIGLVALAIFFFVGRHFISKSESITDRLTNIVTPDLGRFDMWNAAITQWKLAPVIGTGAQTYRFYGRQFRAERFQADPIWAHNDYLQLLAEYGIVGALAFLLFLTAHLFCGLRTFLRLGPRRLAAGTLARSDRLALTIGALGLIGAYALHSFFDFNLHLAANALPVAFVFGILAHAGATREADVDLATKPRAALSMRVAMALFAAILLTQSIRLYPGEVLALRARDALENEDPAAARSLAQQALVHEARNPNIYFYLGRAEESLGNSAKIDIDQRSHYEAALGSFERAHALSPLEESYLLDLAYLYDLLGRFAEGEWMYELALAHDPNSTPIAQMYRAHLSRWGRADR